MWIDDLPAELSRQRRVLAKLLAFAESTDNVRSFAVSCSLARGAADELSDVDAALGVREGAVESVTDAVQAYLTQDADATGLLAHRFGRPDQPALRTFVQFADSTQLDLVVLLAASRPGRTPDEVVLYDPDGRLTEQIVPGPDVVTAELVHEWAFLGWIALADAAKYLLRNSLWEAHFRLHEARDRVWALWAAAKGARYPVFGLSQVLDRDPADLPPGIDATAADLDPTRLRDALRACLRCLDETSRLAAERFDAKLPDGMAEYVTALWDAPIP